MADVKWIKLSVNMFDNDKLQLIEKRRGGDVVVVIWFKLLTLAGKQNNGGVFKLGKKPYTIQMFSKVFGRPKKVIERSISSLCDVGLLDNTDGVISIPSWSDNQNIERLNELKQKRNAKKQKKETDKDIDKDKDKELFNSGFSPPTLEEVAAFCLSKGFNVDPIRFFSYYAGCGWKIGNKPMADWKAVLEIWERDDSKKGRSFSAGLVDKEIFYN